MAGPLGAHCRLSRISPLSDRKKASASFSRSSGAAGGSQGGARRRRNQRPAKDDQPAEGLTFYDPPAAPLTQSQGRLIKLATYPPPKPLSILTTETLDAQLFNIPSRAAKPLKLAP